jgi:hypothetical protein
MNAHPPGRFDRHTAEQLLRGERVRGVDGDLSSLLDAAAAPPPHESQLPGERAALAAFRAAHRAPAAQSRLPRAPTPLLRRHLWMKLAAAVAAAFALGGTAAAVTGVLPIGLGGSPRAPSATASPSSLLRPPQAQPTDSNRSPGPTLQQLCHLYTANPGGNRGPTLNDPAFGPLVHAAGGKDNVPAYCAHLPSGNQPEPKPGPRNDTTRSKPPSSAPQHSDQPGPPS